jgi:hypothetical protein
MSFATNVWRIWSENAEFSQRFEVIVNPDEGRMVGRWEKRLASGVWDTVSKSRTNAIGREPAPALSR